MVPFQLNKCVGETKINFRAPRLSSLCQFIFLLSVHIGSDKDDDKTREEVIGIHADIVGHGTEVATRGAQLK